MTTTTKQYHVYRYQDGSDAIYCGSRDSLVEARTLAQSEPAGLSKCDWETSRLAPISGLSAPNEPDADDMGIEWHGSDKTWGIFAG